MCKTNAVVFVLIKRRYYSQKRGLYFDSRDTVCSDTDFPTFCFKTQVLLKTSTILSYHFPSIVRSNVTNNLHTSK